MFYLLREQKSETKLVRLLATSNHISGSDSQDLFSDQSYSFRTQNFFRLWHTQFTKLLAVLNHSFVLALISMLSFLPFFFSQKFKDLVFFSYGFKKRKKYYPIRFCNTNILDPKNMLHHLY